MSSGGRQNRSRPLRVQTVRGEPYQIGERTLIPVARVVSFGRARGTLRAEGVSGRGAGFVWIRPVMLIEQTPEGERRLPLHDATSRQVRSLLAAGAVLLLTLAAIRWLARRARGR
jgi:uncharacterized spore protein YtfJ